MSRRPTAERRRLLRGTATLLLLWAVAPGCANDAASDAPTRSPAPAPPAVTTPGAAPVATPSTEDAARAARTEDTAAVVDALLEAMASSELAFLRNGKECTGAEAAEHVRTKREHYRESISTPEDFIARAATRSVISGKPYLVKLADGSHELLADWLTARLAEYRAAH